MASTIAGDDRLQSALADQRLIVAVLEHGPQRPLVHSVLDEVRRRALVRLDVRGTPVVELWHASTLGLGRAVPGALAMQRFTTTAEATQAMSSGRAGRSSSRLRPAVHVALWRSVAEEIEAGARQ